MPEELCLPLIVAAFLLWYLARALRQVQSDRAHAPTLVWRQAWKAGWSDWTVLQAVSPSTDYATILTAIRNEAHPGVTAVQFATVAQSAGAPDHTLRVLFMSAVREPEHDRGHAITRC
jgi:hypothetical protein